MLLRATRLWAMSPTRPTVSPSTRPLTRRMVKMSSRPWVGCSWAPSPALTTLRQQVLGQQVRRARRRVPDHHHVDAHRLDVLGGVDERLALAGAGAAGGEVERVGAPSRRAARPKLVRVRVDGSKNRLTTTLPLRSSPLGMSPTPTPRNASAASRSRVSSAAVRPSRPRRCFMVRTL